MPKTGQIYLRNKIVKIVFQNVFSLNYFYYPTAKLFFSYFKHKPH